MIKKVTFLVIILIISGCSSTGANKEEPRTEFSQNEIVNNKIFEVQVSESYHTFGDNALLLDDGYLYVGVKLRMKNISKEKQSVSTFNWKMQNDQGTEVSTSWNSSLGGNSFSGELLPDGEVEGTLYFEQPMNNSGLKLVFYENMFNDEPSFKYILDCDCNVPDLEKDLFSFDEKVLYHDIEYSIKNKQFSNGSGYYKPDKGNVFLGITLETSNLSRETVSINSYYWKVIDSNGVQYDTTYYNPFDEKEYPSTDLLSNGSVSGVLVYEVPKDLSYKLTFYSDYFSDNVKFSFDLN